jgi:hypothetical protein
MYWGGGATIPAMEAALCIKSASFASAARDFLSLAFCPLYRRLAFSTFQRCSSKAHSVLASPSNCSSSAFPFFFGDASTTARGDTYFLNAMVYLSSAGGWREWAAVREWIYVLWRRNEGKDN